jgi:hypothetical protein
MENVIVGFAQSFVSNRITASQELCVGSTCVTPAQFQAMVADANASQSSGQGSGTTSTSDTSPTPGTPPVIQINGDNPAIIQVGDSYNDLGATITGPQADLNLGITTYVNGIETSPVQIDTSVEATDTIDYVVTDAEGNAATSTRIVVIETPTASTSAFDSTASTTEDTATTTTP